MSALSNDRPSAVEIARWCSVERFRPYLRAAGDHDAALALYEWNIAVAGAFYELIGVIEVLLRNTIHARLAAWHRRAGRPGAWFDHPATGLSPQAVLDVAKARSRLRATETEGRIIAELPFGFWRFLLERRHQAQLWPQLRPAFPHLPDGRRHVLRNDVVALHALRNRIAHYEPIHTMNLVESHRCALRIAGYIEPSAQKWAGGLSRVDQVIVARP
ncbi:hypothetical protein [Sporichthya polymorpha]|uniref:hypothetical protein n=1 Tax=Sporichthya polymorpha TaxID=35751 RepID=UPI000688CC3F|nr:hypothetical protein [Sporichthya polymorpha]